MSSTSEVRAGEEVFALAAKSADRQSELHGVAAGPHQRTEVGRGWRGMHTAHAGLILRQACTPADARRRLVTEHIRRQENAPQRRTPTARNKIRVARNVDERQSGRREMDSPRAVNRVVLASGWRQNKRKSVPCGQA